METHPAHEPVPPGLSVDAQPASGGGEAATPARADGASADSVSAATTDVDVAVTLSAVPPISPPILPLQDRSSAVSSPEVSCSHHGSEPQSPSSKQLSRIERIERKSPEVPSSRAQL